MDAWLDGETVAEESVTLHVNSVTAALGTAFFEAMRCYPVSRRGAAVFRFEAHYRRLVRSLSVVGARLPLTAEDLLSAVAEIVSANSAAGQACYIKVMVFWDTVLSGTSLVDLGEFTPRVAVFLRTTPDSFFHNCPRLRCRISSWRRMDDNAMPAQAKATANYYNARLGLTEALAAGYDNAIFLNGRGAVTEAAEANVFVVDRRAMTVATPSLDSGVLPGVIRDSVLEVLRGDARFQVCEERLHPMDLYAADEVFLTNTAQLVRQVSEIDGRQLATGPGTLAGDLRAELVDILFRPDRRPEWFAALPI
ncbi:aminotransferase class IV [Kutzneria sp. CA-103260]|uniref:aminotransferase class IV n=1 Tax=Kutzneria sp. CA-103260 TaxID=2802641 RepID=UPI001BAB2791|nr:aminotransferase class IV [Kutzneria sp. CA-103260]QUQ64982.1 branched-chain amino acid aminotransferase [Kutzneria sp. CA-103260]